MPIVYILLVYSVVGLVLFKGTLENRCREFDHPDKYGNNPAISEIPNLCGSWTCP